MNTESFFFLWARCVDSEIGLTRPACRTPGKHGGGRATARKGAQSTLKHICGLCVDWGGKDARTDRPVAKEVQRAQSSSVC